MSDRQEGVGWWVASDGKWYPPESHPEALNGSGARPTQVYAGFWMRAGAIIIDVILLSIVQAVVVGALGGSTSEVDFTDLISGVAGWLYFALMESSSYQATLGKQALGIKVTDRFGNRVTFGRATGRYFGKIVSGLILAIGFFMAGWTTRRQALHDLMADTLVVRSGTAVAEP